MCFGNQTAYRSYEKTTRESIVFKENLVDDTGAGFPETNAILVPGRDKQLGAHQTEPGTDLSGRGGKEVVNLLVDVNGTGKILDTANLRLDKMVAVDCGRNSRSRKASGHELEDGHLRRVSMHSCEDGADGPEQ